MNKYSIDLPFHIIKIVAIIRESKYDYCIDENGYGWAIIDGYHVEFFVNGYGEILLETVHARDVCQDKKCKI